MKSDRQFNCAGVVKLADTLDLGSNAERCAGSSPVTRTNAKRIPFTESVSLSKNPDFSFEIGVKNLIDDKIKETPHNLQPQFNKNKNTQQKC